MPIYEYRCEQCGHRFEAWLRSMDSPSPADCPNCTATRITRVPSLFGGMKSASGATITSDAGCSTGT
jgi:putative FmdB family regulatory protein